MKKLTSLFLALAMLFTLTGCVYDDLRAEITPAGSGTLAVTLGLTEEAVEVLGMQQQMTDAGAVPFEKDDVRYFGLSGASPFASPEEFNALCADLSGQIREADCGVDPGTLVLLPNSDGSLTLSLIVTERPDFAAVLRERAPQLSEETAASLLSGAVMRYTFVFDTPVRQIVGASGGVSVSGDTVTLDLPAMSAGTYQFTTTSAALTDTAYENTENVVLLDGTPAPLPAYYLKDANGNGTNYVKLRDVASLLDGTSAQYAVDYDGMIRITAGSSYTPNGSEMSTPFHGERTALCNTPVTLVDGVYTPFDALTLTDDQGGGYTYYKLRDLGKALGFNVYWDGELSRVVLQSDRPYTGEKGE